LASGILNTSQQVGGALGLSILSAVAAIVTGAALEDGQATNQATLGGYTAAFATAGFIILIGLAVAIFVIKTKPGKPNQAGQASLH
jgi:sugar phosphate permease